MKSSCDEERERCGRWKSGRDGDQESNGFALIRNKLDDGWPNFFQSICLNAKQASGAESYGARVLFTRTRTRTHIDSISIN